MRNAIAQVVPQVVPQAFSQEGIQTPSTAFVTKSKDVTGRDSVKRAVLDRINLLEMIKLKDSIGSVKTDCVTPKGVAELLQNFSATCGITLDATELNSVLERSDDKKLLARTLTSTNPLSVLDCKPLPHSVTQTSLRKENRTLEDTLPDIQIVMTPGTALFGNTKTDLISSRQDRQAWFGMPSVLYQVDSSKPGFGDVYSFESSKGFTPDFNLARATLSHAQQMKFLQHQTPLQSQIKSPKRFLLQNSGDALGAQVAAAQLPLHRQFSQSLTDLNRVVNLAQAETPDQVLPHNEFLTRLWPWETRAVLASDDYVEALTTALELSMQRRVLHDEINDSRHRHPLVDAYLHYHCSYGENGEVLSHEATANEVERLQTEADQNFGNLATKVDAFITDLAKPVVLCGYAPGESKLFSLNQGQITLQDALEAVDVLLDARGARIENPNDPNPDKNEDSSVRTINGVAYTFIDQTPFASGYHGHAYRLKPCDNQDKVYVLKVAHKRQLDKHRESILREVETASLWKEYGMVPRDFEAIKVGDGYGILKTYVEGPTLAQLIMDNKFFGSLPGQDSPARDAFVSLIISLINKKAYFGDLSPANVIFTKAGHCVVIDSSDVLKTNTRQEALNLYLGESTQQYAPKDESSPVRDHNRYSLNGESGKWGKFVDSLVSGGNNESPEIAENIISATKKFYRTEIRKMLAEIRRDSTLD
ncbi:MAG: hypothetical protein LW629_05295 [Burkholderiales bacterium]|nr:hypothetical protein [Burkholderiales bacterium]